MKKVNLYVAITLWRAFRAGCIARGLSASGVVSNFMQIQVDLWANEKEEIG